MIRSDQQQQSPIRLVEDNNSDEDQDRNPKFIVLAGDRMSSDEDPTYAQIIPRAPLASMEDISLLATPLVTPMSTPGPTPGASPRSLRAARRNKTASAAGEPTIPEMDEETEDGGHHLPDATGRFASPARRNNLLRDSLINQAYAPPVRWQPHQQQPLLLDPPPDYDQAHFVTSTPVKQVAEDEKNHVPDERETLLARSPTSDDRDGSAGTVQFLTPRNLKDPVYSSKRSIKKSLGSRVHAAEEEAEFLALDAQPPYDRLIKDVRVYEAS